MKTDRRFAALIAALRSARTLALDLKALGTLSDTERRSLDVTVQDLNLAIEQTQLDRYRTQQHAAELAERRAA